MLPRQILQMKQSQAVADFSREISGFFEKITKKRLPQYAAGGRNIYIYFLPESRRPQNPFRLGGLAAGSR